MDILCAHAKSRDINSMWAGVSALNVEAIKFHEAIDFKIVARLPEVGYKFDSFIDLVLMKKFVISFLVLGHTNVDLGPNN